MKTNLITISILITIIMMISLTGCENKKDPIVAEIDYMKEAVLERGISYYIPLVFVWEGEEIANFTVFKSPINSKRIKKNGNNYLEWEPEKKGEFEIKMVADENQYWEQSITIMVR